MIPVVFDSGEYGAVDILAYEAYFAPKIPDIHCSSWKPRHFAPKKPKTIARRNGELTGAELDRQSLSWLRREGFRAA